VNRMGGGQSETGEGGNLQNELYLPVGRFFKEGATDWRGMEKMELGGGGRGNLKGVMVGRG